MKKLFFFIAFLFVTTFTFAQDVYVQGYTRSNGTSVQGYYRTAPNYTRNDNYSTIGNINPHTGSYGTKPADSYYSSSSYYSTPTYYSSTPVYTGSRGGQYYINSNGNKTYISR
jgi:hypothetical protein